MYAFREGSPPRTRHSRRGRPFDRTLVGVVVMMAVVSVGSGCARAVSTSQATGVMPVFVPPPEVESSYVSLVETESELVAIPDSAMVAVPSAEPIAAAYARRYEIAPELALDITQHALDAGLDPELAFRLVRVESVFKVSARGPQGALGLTQLMPGTARALDRSLDTEREILDPDANLRVGFRYLRQMIERYDDVRLGLLAYNRGQTSVDRALRRGVDPENGYSHKVLGTRGSRPYAGPGLLQAPGE